MGLDRLALLKARLSKPKAALYRPAGMHATENPEDKVTRVKGKLWDYNAENVSGPKVQTLSEFQKAENVVWYKKAAKMPRRWLVEISRAPDESVLTKIAFGEPEWVPRVPPWQK